jgi:hypothetical protein
MEKSVDKGADGRPGRLIRKVTFTYRLEDDPEDAERTLTLEHDGEGEAIDGIIWSDELIGKLAYLERDGAREVRKQRGSAAWKTSSAQSEAVAASARNCIWLHDVTCIWSEYCSDS